MPTKLSKQLRSRKVRLAFERKRKQYNLKLNMNERSSQLNDKSNSEPNSHQDISRQKTQGIYSSYDTVTSAHDIEQDAHLYYDNTRGHDSLSNISEKSSDTSADSIINTAAMREAHNQHSTNTNHNSRMLSIGSLH
jgi:hypothetical protein